MTFCLTGALFLSCALYLSVISQSCMFHFFPALFLSLPPPSYALCCTILSSPACTFPNSSLLFLPFCAIPISHHPSFLVAFFYLFLNLSSVFPPSNFLPWCLSSPSLLLLFLTHFPLPLSLSHFPLLSYIFCLSQILICPLSLSHMLCLSCVFYFSLHFSLFTLTF